ncbi:GTPase RsgA [Microbulbifer sp.]|uniref:GTPase RsgA n=1 Tax=Microbulbifer sp. TaxID=1908541 RepID=UPI00258A9205|nr:GTPase RsgA [Microbulbifer sp.]
MGKSLISRRPAFRRGAATGSIARTTESPLNELGWKPFFQQQLSLDELTDCDPVRVMAVHRSQIDVAGDAGEEPVLVTGPVFEDALEKPAVADWLLLARDSRKPLRRLDRSSLFKRMAPGAKQAQLIAANIDNVLIVSSCNHDFNLSRVERYLAMVKEAGCRACLVLTKADMSDDHAQYREALKTYRDLHVVLVNALDSPGMRELGLADVTAGLSATFSDIEALATRCRFGDCAHDSEPGCAVQAAIELGELDERRLRNWRKLEREVARNNKTLAQSRGEERAFTQLVHDALRHSRARNNKT